MTVNCLSVVWQSVKSKMDKEQEYCRRCGKRVTDDEIGATKKLVNRGSTVYYCLDCLAENFDVTRADIEKKIVYFKEMGCTLFQG